LAAAAITPTTAKGPVRGSRPYDVWSLSGELMSANWRRSVVVAIGGNALIGEGERGTIAEQFGNARAAACEVAKLVEAGWRVVVTHGNGPQVGFILLRSEMIQE